MRKPVALVCGTCLLALTGAAQAQEAPQQATVAVEEGTTPAAADIVVTALRTGTTMSRTPVAMSAVSGDDLIQTGITNTQQLTDVIPNLSIVRVGNGVQITIRGVTSTDTSEKGDPSAAFLLDGVYIGRPQAQEVSFFDVQRVEVLRGPQGTLYGRNTTAGVVNLITAEPVHRFAASADAMYESFDHVMATGMVNVPLGDMFALRAAVNYDRRDNYIRRPGATDGFTLDPFRDNLSGRLSLLAEPTDRLKIIVRGDYGTIKGVPTNSVPAANFFSNIASSAADSAPLYRPGVSAADLRTSTFAEAVQARRDNRLWGVMGQADWTLGDVVVSYVGSYRETRRRDVFSLLGGLRPGTYDGDYWQNSQELRLAYDRGPLKAQVGAYYFKENGAVAAFLLNPSPFVPAPGALRYGFPQDPTIAVGKALFGQASLEIADGLRLTGGVRYSHDDKSRRGNTVLDYPGDRQIILQINDAQRTFSKVTWRAGADYDVPGLGLLYATVSTGYKAGGFNDGCEARAGAPASCVLTADGLYYQPETLTSYEGGFKFAFGPAFRLEGSVFHYDYKGLQLTSTQNVCGGPCAVTSNAGAAKVDGVELNATVRPDRKNSFNIQANYLDARYTDYSPVSGISYAGRPLSRSPKVSINAAYTFTQPLGNGGSLEATARTRFSSRYDLTDLGSRLFFYQPSFTKSDLSLTYNAPGDRFYVGAFARNLENNIVLTNVTGGTAGIGRYDASANFEDPRTWGVRTGVKF
ncbi:MAG: TonB-dependent receptor [Sphingomonas taxi]|uniref:TonB-dependent receptor n=1 Tax=Sphingomonas taxi TaxID=1549858 RepID=A0A2W5RI15_9SPHN|nr:MAG: TonB-dependent receptor [Sphingomonas taxi]